MVEFGGYELPVQYTSIRAEHGAVREAAGLFDVSHMGQIEFEGNDAIARDRDAGLEHRLVGFALQGRGVARAGCAVAAEGKTIWQGHLGRALPNPRQVHRSGVRSTREGQTG
jgi:glycine cleavage system aminomethyltransferase T